MIFRSGEIINVADHKTMRTYIRVESVVGSVGLIASQYAPSNQPLDVSRVGFKSRGPSIRSQKLQAVAKPMAQAYLQRVVPGSSIAGHKCCNRRTKSFNRNSQRYIGQGVSCLSAYGRHSSIERLFERLFLD